MEIFYGYLIVLGVVSLINFCLYAADKSKAKRGEWRIPERVLLGFSFFFGAIGGYLGMLLCRHKTKHWYFHAINIIGLIWQIVAAVYLFVAFV